MWHPNYDTCPRDPEHKTEIFERNELHLAERCRQCRWQVNFYPEVTAVAYSSMILTPDDSD